MSGEIIQFSAFADAAKEAKEAARDHCAPGALARLRAKRVAKQLKRQAVLATAPDTLTETCKNKYAREARREVWRRHESSMKYWDARRAMDYAIGRVKNNGCAEGDLHPDTGPYDCHQLVNYWRAAIRVLILTPAPSQDAVAWKQRQVNDKYLGLDASEIKRAIAEDVTWLKMHPTRTKVLPKKRGQK
jgi:hypothetical protein